MLKESGPLKEQGIICFIAPLYSQRTGKQLKIEHISAYNSDTPKTP